MKKSEERVKTEQEIRAEFNKMDEEGQQLLLNSMNRMIMMRDGNYPEAKALDDKFAARIFGGERVSRKEFRAHDARMNALLGIA